MPRLLCCNTCKTVDILPDYASENDPEAHYDHTLKDKVEEHLRRYGGGPDNHKANLFQISEAELDLIDPNRLKQAIHDGRLEEFLREEREQYKEDAMGCYNLHNRPVYGAGYGSGCPDYKDKSRAIGPTKGIPEDQWNYICDFCVYNSYVEHAARKKLGLYNQ